MIVVTKTSGDAIEGTHSLYLYKSYLSPENLVLPPLLPCCSLDYLGWQLLKQPLLFYIFFISFHPCLPHFPHGVYNYFAVSCAFSPLFRPPRSYLRSRRPRSHLRYCPRFRPRSHPVFVYGTVYVCIVITYSRIWINRARLPILLVVS